MGKEHQIDSDIVIDYLDNKIPSKGMEIVNEIVDAHSPDGCPHPTFEDHNLSI